MRPFVAVVLVLALGLLWTPGAGGRAVMIACGRSSSEFSATNYSGVLGYYSTSTIHRDGELVFEGSAIHNWELIGTVVLTVALLGGARVLWTRGRRRRVWQAG